MDIPAESEAISKENKSLAIQFDNMSVAADEKTVADLPVEIKYQECFYIWLEGLKDSKFPIGLKTKQNEKQSNPKGGMTVAISESELKVYECCHLIYHLTETGSYDDADKAMKELAEIMESLEEKTSVDITQGYSYIINNLKAYFLWKKGESDSLASHLATVTIKSFPELSLNGQIAVIRFKLMTLQYFRLKNQYSVAEELAGLEPKNPKWFYYKYFYYRDSRRKGALTAPPEEKEMTAIAKALELEPDNVVYIVTGFQNLSERVRYFNQTELTDNPITWTDKQFSSIEEIVDYMKAETKLFLKCSEKVPGYCYTLLGEIFSSCLPRHLLDFTLAEKCIRRALDVSPNCTRINHRMGIFLWKTNRNFQSAVTYLQRASELSSQNFHSRADLIHLLLSKPDEQEDVLRQCFKDYLGEENVWAWDDKEISELKFLNGCFLMMTDGDATETTKCWIESYNLNPTANHFVSAYHQSKRFMWNHKIFNFARCKDVISHALLKGGLTSEELDAITKISEGILKGLQTLENDGRNSNRNLRQNQKPRSSESDESSWRSSKNRDRGPRHSSYSEEVENMPLGQRNQGRPVGKGKIQFSRNRTTSGSEDSNWRQ